MHQEIDLHRVSLSRGKAQPHDKDDVGGELNYATTMMQEIELNFAIGTMWEVNSIALLP